MRKQTIMATECVDTMIVVTMANTKTEDPHITLLGGSGWGYEII